MTVVLVCGGRDYKGLSALYDYMDALHRSSPIHKIVSGGARGAEIMALQWALDRGVAGEQYPANWQKHGKAAGAIRNQEMLDKEDVDCVVAFPGGRGTADMIRKARIAGVPVYMALELHSP